MVGGENVSQNALQPMVIYAAGGKSPSPGRHAHRSLGTQRTQQAKHCVCVGGWRRLRVLPMS